MTAAVLGVHSLGLTVPAAFSFVSIRSKNKRQRFLSRRSLALEGGRLDIKVPSRKEALQKPVRVPGKTHQKADPPWRAAA